MTGPHGDKAMAGDRKTDGRGRLVHWRRAACVIASLLLLLPLVAMQFTDEVDWDVVDFATFGALLAGVIVPFDIAVRKTCDTSYLAAVGVALGAAFFLIWANLAVGIIGNEGDPANLMYVVVLATGIIGAIIASFRPRGMARALLATAIAQALVALIAVIARLGAPWSGPAEILIPNGVFVALFAGSAWLFRRAGREDPQSADGHPQGRKVLRPAGSHRGRDRSYAVSGDVAVGRASATVR